MVAKTKTAEEDVSTETRQPTLGTPRGLTDSERRSYVRIPPEVDYVPNELFASPDAEGALFGEGSEEIKIPQWVNFPEDAGDAPVKASKKVRLKAKEEVALFLRYNYARFRLGELVGAQLGQCTTARARKMIAWFERAMKCRADLVRANLALVLAMAKRAKVPNVEFGELVSEGNMALLRSVEKFDVARGFKFSTYACRAILKCFNRLATKTGRYRQRFPTEFDPDLERSDHDVRRHETRRADSIDAVREILSRNQARLTEVERTVVLERFAIGSSGRGRTLSEVGEMVGLTNERVRQIQKKALRKIRAVLSDDFLAA